MNTSSLVSLEVELVILVITVLVVVEVVLLLACIFGLITSTVLV